MDSDSGDDGTDVVELQSIRTIKQVHAHSSCDKITIIISIENPKLVVGKAMNEQYRFVREMVETGCRIGNVEKKICRWYGSFYGFKFLGLCLCSTHGVRKKVHNVHKVHQRCRVD